MEQPKFLIKSFFYWSCRISQMGKLLAHNAFSWMEESSLDCVIFTIFGKHYQ